MEGENGRQEKLKQNKNRSKLNEFFYIPLQIYLMKNVKIYEISKKKKIIFDSFVVFKIKQIGKFGFFPTFFFPSFSHFKVLFRIQTEHK